MDVSLPGVHLGALLPLERSAEECLLAVAWGDEPRPLTRSLARAVVRLALEGFPDQSPHATSASTLVSMPVVERVVLALAHRDLAEADLLSIVSSPEAARSLLVMRDVVAHPSYSPVLLARAVSQGWKGGNTHLNRGTLSFLSARCGAHGAAAAAVAVRWGFLGDSFVEALALDLGDAGLAAVEVFQTLASDADLPSSGHARNLEDLRRDLSALAEQARLLSVEARSAPSPAPARSPEPAPEDGSAPGAP